MEGLIFGILRRCLKSYPIKYLPRTAAALASHTGAFRGARILSLPRKSPGWEATAAPLRKRWIHKIHPDPPGLEPLFCILLLLHNKIKCLKNT